MNLFRNFFLFALVILISVSSVFAQNDDFKSTISVDAGFSLVGAIFKAADLDPTATFSSYSIPAIEATYDYSIAKWFSLGAGVSYQMMGMEVDYQNENFKVKVSRLNFGVRPLFHYGNSGKLDMYSGFRVGMNKWGASVEDNGTTYKLDDYFNASYFGAQLVLFGFRGYFTDNFGCNFELAAGSPHFLAIGLNYRM